MAHYWFFVFGFIGSIVLAFVLEITRQWWSPRWNAPVALFGILISGGWATLLTSVSGDVPITVPPYDLIAWLNMQWWIMFVVTGTPILVWDKFFVDKSHAREVEDLRSALKDAKQEIRDMQEHVDA